MDYILIIILQFVGIGLHVAQKCLELDKVCPNDTLGDVFSMFWKRDKITLFISGFVLILNLAAHYIVEVYTPEVTVMKYYPLYSFGIALVFGYAGQRVIYKYLGSAEKFLDTKIENKLS